MYQKMKAFFKKLFNFSKKLCQVLHDKFQRFFHKNNTKFAIFGCPH
jgi:hypothetical protein